MKRSLAVAFAAFVAIVASAHIGSPDVVFDGVAGAYAVRVIVRPPDVVPGLAQIVVRVEASDVQHVLIRPVYWRTGVAGSPKADEAARVAGQDRIFTGQLWLMSRGAYSVYVTVQGSRGSGTAIVPVNALATGRLALPRGLGIILVMLGAVLVAGLVTIIRAASGEALVPAGEAFGAASRRRARLSTAIAVPVLALVLFGGAKWWNAVDASYKRTMYRPPRVSVAFTNSRGHRTLRLELRDTSRFHAISTPLVPDHGKMMHLFLIGYPGMETFAHLHPSETDSLVFTGEVPWLPVGRYRLFGDVTTEAGMSVTVSNTIDLPDANGAVAPSDSDDSWTRAASVPLIAPGATARLGDGYTMQWTGDPVVRAGIPVDLRFTVRDSTGAVASLVPYMGMAAHAVVMRDDGGVFVHLHPMGTISTAAQRVFVLRDRGDTSAKGRLSRAALDSAPAMAMPMRMRGALSIPYEFPKPGRYRVWVQVEPPGRILTGVFDVDVQ